MTNNGSKKDKHKIKKKNTANIESDKFGKLLNPMKNRPTKKLLTDKSISPQALDRISAIPLLFGKESGIEKIGKVHYDSWSQGQAVVLRDVTGHCVRHVVLKAGRVRVEIIAERRQTDWEFIARIYHKEQILNDSVLKAGNRKLLPSSGGFYRWTSKFVPHAIRVFSYDRNLSFEKLSW
jgi:hypothetical protein